MKIGTKDLGRKVFIVAEIGNNHEGDFSVAAEMVKQAAACGVDAVKFQTFKTENFVKVSDLGRFNRLKKYELQFSQFTKLSRLAHKNGLLFLSTPLDLESAAFLKGIVDGYKVASGDNDFYPLLDFVARARKPVIVSSGISDLKRIKCSVDYLKKQWKKIDFEGKVAVLHCVSCYPAPIEEINLRAIPLMSRILKCPIGYSDHTLGNEACLFAVVIGACIIEKHFTLDKSFSDFRDHKLSADPPEMKEMVDRIRLIEKSLGEYNKSIQPCEIHNRELIRRSIVAEKDLPKGHKIIYSDLAWMRPGGGLAPGNERFLIGKTMKIHKYRGEQFKISDFK